MGTLRLSHVNTFWQCYFSCLYLKKKNKPPPTNQAREWMCGFLMSKQEQDNVLLCQSYAKKWMLFLNIISKSRQLTWNGTYVLLETGSEISFTFSPISFEEMQQKYGSGKGILQDPINSCWHVIQQNTR